MIKSRIFLITFLCSSFIHGQKLPAHPQWQEKVNAYLQTQADSGLFSGTVSIRFRDVHFQAAYGVADRRFALPMQKEYRFDIASVNKSFIAGLSLMAVQEGHWRLDDQLNALLRRLDLPGQFPSDITLHQLLSHRAGLPDYDGVPENLRRHAFRGLKRAHFTTKEYLRFISALPMAQAVDSGFYYSNFAYHLLAALLEAQYKTTLNALLQEKICRPLKLTSLVSSADNSEILPKLSRPYLFQTGEWITSPFIDRSVGRCRIYGNAADLTAWSAALGTQSILEPPYYQAMMTDHHPEDPRWSYGYGWVVYGPGDHFKMGDLDLPFRYSIHGGSTDGYKSMLVHAPEQDLHLALLANSGNRTAETALTKTIVELLFAP